MEEELEELNRSEFARNSVYAEAWTRAAAKWWNRQGHVPQPPALRPEHAVALLAYTLEEPRMYLEFNAAVREAGRSREKYLGAFHFKTLHFLLTEALRHQSVRFGHFTSTSLQNKTIQVFGQDTIFLVETCYGARISNFSSFPEEEEVLIPPFESFEVTDVAHDGNRARIQLRSQDARSTYNCELVKGRSVPRAPPPRFGGLLLAATALAAAGGP
ncbi:unnamed protein product [Bubo scandiacus]